MGNDRIHRQRLVLGDAFGQVLMACQAAGAVPGVAFELVERSDGHLGVMGAARYFATPGHRTETSRFATRCGLAERGWEVTGVEFSDVALANAQHLAAVRGVQVEWILADLRTYQPQPHG